MFNLWIYNRRSACSARMQHGSLVAVQPADMCGVAAGAGQVKAVASAEGATRSEDNVLPFRTPQEAQRDTAQRSGRTGIRGRPKGRGAKPHPGRE